MSQANPQLNSNQTTVLTVRLSPTFKLVSTSTFKLGFGAIIGLFGGKAL